MLILTRRPVESICIGDEVTVTVLGVVGNQVRFGIEAPRTITIDRAEIHERKKRSAAALSATAGATSQRAHANGNYARQADTPESQEVNGNLAVTSADARR
jgi:carbon storage regulator